MVKKARELERLKDKYRILVENMGQGVLSLDKNMVITFVNDRLCDAWGYERNELLGKKVSSFFEGVGKKKIKSEFMKRRKGKSSTYALTVKTKQGKDMFFSVSAVPFVDKGGKFRGSIAIVSEITGLQEKLKQHAVELEKEVEERTDQLVELYRGVAITEERNRLAQEIHDGLAQSLATALLRIDFCERILDDDPKKAREGLLELREMLAKCIKATRQVIFELRLPRFHRMGFATVLKQYLEEFQKKTGIAPSLRIRLEESLPMKVQVGTYRIIREAMNNIRKHALAKHVELRLRTDKKGDLHLAIEDDGKGFDLEKILAANKSTRHFGLKAMKEQVKLLGGVFDVKTAKGRGTRIEIKVPLKE